jgi:hypothetical protein
MSASRVNVTIESVTETQMIPPLKSLLSVGDLVYRFNNHDRNVPNFRGKSNRRYSLETDSSSSSEENSKTQRFNDPWKSQLSGKQTNAKDQDDCSELSREHSKRTRRSLEAKIAASGNSSDSSSSSSSSGSEEKEEQPELQLDSAPCMPLIPLFVGIQGSKVRASKQFDPVQAVVKLAIKIGSDLEKPGSLVDDNTLPKFTLMTRILRSMDSRQIDEATRALEPSSPKNSNLNDNIKWGAW